MKKLGLELLKDDFWDYFFSYIHNDWGCSIYFKNTNLFLNADDETLNYTMKNSSKDENIGSFPNTLRTESRWRNNRLPRNENFLIYDLDPSETVKEMKYLGITLTKGSVSYLIKKYAVSILCRLGGFLIWESAQHIIPAYGKILLLLYKLSIIYGLSIYA